jgi:hypothetical protein
MTMSALDNTPVNKNFLSPLNFKFAIKRSPHLNFFVQKVNLPSIRLPDFETPNPFIPIPQFGTRLQYQDLSVTFKIDEDFQNYLEIHNWIRALGKPDNYDEYAEIAKIPEYTGEGIHSDLSLVVLNSAKAPNYEFTFRNAFPIYLSDLVFDSTYSDVDFITGTVTFRYIIFDIAQV